MASTVPQRHSRASWLYLAVLGALAVILGTLQYRWLGDVSRAERDRLRAGLQTSLMHVSRDFNTELGALYSGLYVPASADSDAAREVEYAARYEHLRRTSRTAMLVSSLSIVRPVGGTVTLRKFDTASGGFRQVDWPAEWSGVRDWFQARLAEPRGDGLAAIGLPGLVEMPVFEPHEGPGPRHEHEWLLIDLNLAYIRDTLLPGLLRRDLGQQAFDEYAVRVTNANDPSKVIYSSGRDASFDRATADAAVPLFDLWPGIPFRGPGFPGERLGFGPGGRERRPHPEFERPRPRFDPAPDERSGPGRGRWEMIARHRAGSLEAVVARTRAKNLAVSSAVLLLILLTGASLVRYTRRSQRLAAMQMQFVAGVTHELRTPLAVMRTAGYNLQGPMGDDRDRVHRYGALIQDESEKLTAIVDQVLAFANAQGGRSITNAAPLALPGVVDDAIAAARNEIDKSGCRIEESVPPDLPAIQGDATALKHALQNLLVNAAKYGAAGGWIGVSAARAGETQVEVRISDRGPGIPAADIQHIFEPFYRGSNATADQIHGTGLGLSLVQRIIEAHGGNISVSSEPGKGSTFSIRLPLAPATAAT